MIGRGGRGWIGVDLGTHSVKLVQVERHGSGVRVTEGLIIRRSEPWQDTTSTTPPIAPSAEELRAGLSLGQRFVGRDAAVTLTMSLCDVRGVQVDEAPDADRRDLVARELETVLGPTAQQMDFDFWPLELPVDKQALPENVLAASVSHDWTQQVAQDLMAARLTGQVLDVLPLALGRAVELGAPGSSREPVVAVDWGHRRATLCLILDGQPTFVRNLRDCGFASVISALARSLSVTDEESQKLLTDHGVPPGLVDEGDELQAVVAEVAALPLQAFADELNRTITFLQQQRRHLRPSRVVLFGGGGAVRNIGPFLTEKLELPVVPWSLPDVLPTSARLPPLPVLGPAVALSALAWEAT